MVKLSTRNAPFPEMNKRGQVKYLSVELAKKQPSKTLNSFLCSLVASWTPLS
ncbi:hypothetical protein EMPG_13149 [Blastomyces silverae]|uniref:Uncharacterized protein n=1 Tax=Blastomyces silverae TaxID=2060906 RepID=A0A0H1BJW3_9EURO|nr:hypothetical protein EMPG_13149 [Blastomyces silverae]